MLTMQVMSLHGCAAVTVKGQWGQVALQVYGSPLVAARVLQVLRRALPWLPWSCRVYCDITICTGMQPCLYNNPMPMARQPSRPPLHMHLGSLPPLPCRLSVCPVDCETLAAWHVHVPVAASTGRL